MFKHLIAGLLLPVAAAMPAFAVNTPEPNKPAVKANRSPAKVAAHITSEHEVQAPVVLSAEQLAISKKVLIGKIQCELAVQVTMTPDAHSPGRFMLEIGHKRFVMEPVLTSTGAVRLESAATGAVWLQLANKSMLMNQKEGKRLADDCMNPDQLLVAQALERNPVPGLLDAPKAALVPIVAGGGVQEMVPNARK